MLLFLKEEQGCEGRVFSWGRKLKFDGGIYFFAFAKWDGAERH